MKTNDARAIVWDFLIPRFAPGWKWYQQCFVPNGWKKLVRQLCFDLDEVWTGFEDSRWRGADCWALNQAKEKFGGLRFYVMFPIVLDGTEPNGTQQDMDARIEKSRELIQNAEGKSLEICEHCGDEGDRRSVDGWMASVCQDHYDSWLRRAVAERVSTVAYEKRDEMAEHICDDKERKRRAESRERTKKWEEERKAKEAKDKEAKGDDAH